ncbi:peptidase M20 [Phycicoccus sp. Root563]|uniref:ArgE/DapE family deacylase n=1 Tax=Phycicoccus sp. Root563 TaxID=1736562 RepID=UPI00070332BB|nr:ArgE/DapE family deacylase [Phycicoccus sp. Root563]KQZ87399.1 peptidase M20 [Phycicoccus sp. Root563]
MTSPLQAPTEQERRVLSAVDTDALLADLAALVAFAPVGGSAGEVAVQRWCAGRLRELGLHVTEWDVDLAAEAAHPDFPGMEVARDAVVGVVGTWGPAGRDDLPALALCGHTDVVPVEDPARWRTDPFVLGVAGGTAAGRGSCDMLGGVASILAAVRALTTVGVTPTRSLAVHLVSGEEDGGVGAFATLRAGHLADACLIAEPTSGAVIPTNAGSLTFRLEVDGRAAHGSTRTVGESALDHLAAVQDCLRDLEATRNADAPAAFAHLDLVAPISIGIVRAGTWASTVPDLLVAEGRYGVLPGEPLDAARRVFEDSIVQLGQRNRWLAEHPVRVTWPGGAFASGTLPEGHALLGETVEAAVHAGAAAPRVEGAPYGSDLRHYAAQGVPTLQFGPGELRHAHAVDESVAVDELVDCARTYALLALRRCVAPAATPGQGDDAART